MRRGELAEGDDDRRLTDDAVPAVHHFGQLRQGLQAVAGVGLLGALLDRLHVTLAATLRPTLFHAACGLLHGAEEVVLREARVPDVERPHLRVTKHGLAIGGHRRERRDPGVGGGALIVASRDREARGHALHVVLERPGERLVEVVQAEEQGALRRCEQAEVRQVGVAAELHLETRGRRVLQVGCHDLRRASVERERRDRHPPVPYRHEIGIASQVLFLEQRNRVGAVRSRRPPRMAGERARFACVLSPGASFGDLRVRDRVRRLRALRRLRVRHQLLPVSVHPSVTRASFAPLSGFGGSLPIAASGTPFGRFSMRMLRRTEPTEARTMTGTQPAEPAAPKRASAGLRGVHAHRPVPSAGRPDRRRHAGGARDPGSHGLRDHRRHAGDHRPLHDPDPDRDLRAARFVPAPRRRRRLGDRCDSRGGIGRHRPDRVAAVRRVRGRAWPSSPACCSSLRGCCGSASLPTSSRAAC